MKNSDLSPMKTNKLSAPFIEDNLQKKIIFEGGCNKKKCNKCGLNKKHKTEMELITSTKRTASAYKLKPI